MSDIRGIFTVYDLALFLALAASPGLVIGAIAGTLLTRHRLRGALIGAVIGFVLCLGALLLWLFVLK
jgi:hypothetical protein